jgi:hypothetical protein
MQAPVFIFFTIVFSLVYAEAASLRSAADTRLLCSQQLAVGSKPDNKYRRGEMQSGTLYAATIKKTWSLPPGSLAARLVDQVAQDRLINQTDFALLGTRENDRLGEDSLIVPGGGLCVNVSAAAIALAHVSQFAADAKVFGDHPQEIRKAVQSVSKMIGGDARFGCDVKDAINYLQANIKNEMLTDSLRFRKANDPQEELDLFPGEIAFAGVRISSGTLHAIIIVATRGDQVLVFDPMDNFQFYPMTVTARDRGWLNVSNPSIRENVMKAVLKGQTSRVLLSDGYVYGEPMELWYIRDKSNYDYSPNTLEWLKK